MQVFNRVHGKSSWRRLAAAAACAVLLSGAATAGIEDVVLRFSTPGPDRYADGTVVADGECYALVWSPAGKAFSGFNADGTPVSPGDRVVLAGALARDGKCRDAIFQVPAEEYAELEGGEWAVCLVDTRMGDGIPAGVVDGQPLRVNRWGLAQSGVKVEAASTMSAAASSPKRLSAAGVTRSGASGVRAGTLSAVPPNLRPPRITAMEIAEGEVVLAVEDTMPYLSYTIKSGAEPGDLKTDYFADVVDGDDGGEIVVGTVKSANRRFFKVTRAE
jgi:hypothetical protein